MPDFGECEEQVRDRQIVRRDPDGSKGKSSPKFVIQNPDRACVRVVQIDNCVITDGLRCDWLFVAMGDPTEIYVELKGSDVGHAIEQIGETIAKVSEDVRTAPKRCYIVCTHVRPQLLTKIQRAQASFRRDCNAELKVRNMVVRQELRRTAGSPRWA